MKRRVLFICEGNIHRSRTAERLYASTPGIKVRSAGLASSSRVQVTEELLAWANDIFVMESRLIHLLQSRFVTSRAVRWAISLDIPDDYQFMQPELVAILTERLRLYLGHPVEEIPQVRYMTCR